MMFLTVFCSSTLVIVRVCLEKPGRKCKVGECMRRLVLVRAGTTCAPIYAPSPLVRATLASPLSMCVRTLSSSPC